MSSSSGNGNVLEQLEQLRDVVDAMHVHPQLRERTAWLRGVIDSYAEGIHSEMVVDDASRRRSRRSRGRGEVRGRTSPSERHRREQRRIERARGGDRDRERDFSPMAHSRSPPRGGGGGGGVAGRGQQRPLRASRARDDTADERDDEDEGDPEPEPAVISPHLQGRVAVGGGGEGGRNVSSSSADPSSSPAVANNNGNNGNNDNDGGGGGARDMSRDVSRSVTPENNDRRQHPPRPPSSVAGEVASVMAAAALHVPLDVERMARGQRPLPRRPATPEPVNRRRGETPPPGSSGGVNSGGGGGGDDRGGSNSGSRPGGSGSGARMSDISLPGIQQSVSDLMVGLNISGTPAAMPSGLGGGSGGGFNESRWSESTQAFSRSGGAVGGGVSGGVGGVAGAELGRLLSERPGFTELVAGVLASLRALPTDELRYTCFSVLSGSPGHGQGQGQSSDNRHDDRGHDQGQGLESSGRSGTAEVDGDGDDAMDDDRDRNATAAAAAMLLGASGFHRPQHRGRRSRGRGGSFGSGGSDGFGGLWERTMISPVAESPRSDHLAPGDHALGPRRRRRISREIEAQERCVADGGAGSHVMGSPLGGDDRDDDSEDPDNDDAEAEELGSEFDYPEVFGELRSDETGGDPPRSTSPTVSLQPPPPPHARPWGEARRGLQHQSPRREQEQYEEVPDLIGERWDGGDGVSGGVIRVGGERDGNNDDDAEEEEHDDRDEEEDDEDDDNHATLEPVDADDFFMIGGPNEERGDGGGGGSGGNRVGYAEAEGTLFGYDDPPGGGGTTMRSYSPAPRGGYEVSEPDEAAALAALLSHTGQRPRRLQSGDTNMDRDEFARGLHDLIGLTDLPGDFMTIPPSSSVPNSVPPRSLTPPLPPGPDLGSSGGFGSFDRLHGDSDDPDTRGDNSSGLRDEDRDENGGAFDGEGIDPLEIEDNEDDESSGNNPAEIQSRLPDMDEVRALVRSHADAVESILSERSPGAVRGVTSPSRATAGNPDSSTPGAGAGMGMGMGIDARITFKPPPQTLFPGGGLRVDALRRMERLFEAEQAAQAEALVSGRSDRTLGGQQQQQQMDADQDTDGGGRGANGNDNGNDGVHITNHIGVNATADHLSAFAMGGTPDVIGDDTAPLPPPDNNHRHPGGGGGGGAGGGNGVGSSRAAPRLSLDDAARGLPFSDELNYELMDALSAVVAGSSDAGRMAAASAAADAAAEAVSAADAALSDRSVTVGNTLLNVQDTSSGSASVNVDVNGARGRGRGRGRPK